MTEPDHPTVPEHVRENYRQIVADTGQTWGQLADQFDRDAAALPDVHAAPYRSLAAWARDQDTGDTPVAEPEQPQPAEPPRKKTATPTRPARTA